MRLYSLSKRRTIWERLKTNDALRTWTGWVQSLRNLMAKDLFHIINMVRNSQLCFLKPEPDRVKEQKCIFKIQSDVDFNKNHVDISFVFLLMACESEPYTIFRVSSKHPCEERCESPPSLYALKACVDRELKGQRDKWLNHCILYPVLFFCLCIGLKWESRPKHFPLSQLTQPGNHPCDAEWNLILNIA